MYIVIYGMYHHYDMEIQAFTNEDHMVYDIWTLVVHIFIDAAVGKKRNYSKEPAC